jgi:phytoene dehydrogenase-like protein
VAPLDVAIVGAGHNGLVAAAYLAKAGLSVEVLERRDVVGGACVTEELIPGFRCSSCAYVANDLTPKVLRDLDLRGFGLELYQTGVSVASIAEDGRSFALYNDLDRSLRELARVGAREAEGLVRLGVRMARLAELVQPALLREPPSLERLREELDAVGEGSLYDEFFTGSAAGLLDRYFESDLVKGMFAFFAMVSTYGGPSTPGTAYVYAHHSWGSFEGKLGQFAFPRGGMGAITAALASCAAAHGAVVRVGAEVASIEADEGRAAAVVLASGDVVEARAVVSNADPHVTWGLVDGVDRPALDYRGTMARVHLALDGLPRFVGQPDGVGPYHRGVTVTHASVERLERTWEAQREGRIYADPVVEFTVPSAHDPTVAPPGKHLLITGVQQIPFELAEGTWDDAVPAFERTVIAQLERVAPGIGGQVIGTATVTPLDLQRTYGLTGGNIFHGALTLDQLFAARPSYRTDVAGLYLCGSGTHPGGGVSGAPGHNAAAVVLEDLVGRPPERRAEWAPRRGANAIEQLVRRPRARRAGVALAKQPWLRPVVERLSEVPHE